MKARCYNTKLKQYKDWGGRGIKVCKRWHEFSNFYTDMVDGYSAGLSLDRIKVDGDYKPSNCRWVTKAEQNANKRNTPDTKLIKALLAKGLTYPQYTNRLNLGWSDNQAKNIPFGQFRKHHSDII